MARDIYINDDYAGLEVDGHKFYYGYEFDTKQDDGELGWGFEYDSPIGKTRFNYKTAKAHYEDVPDRFETADCLLWFIALMIEQRGTV